MNIDKKKRVITIQLRRMITLMVFFLAIVIIMLSFNRNIPFLGLKKYNWVVVLTCIYIVSLVLESLLEFNYIYFSDDKNKLTLRYFSLGYFNRKKTSVEIPIQEFVDFEVKEYLWGFKQKIVLQRIYKNQIAKYPAVSISILNKEERNNLILALDHYKQKK